MFQMLSKECVAFFETACLKTCFLGFLALTALISLCNRSFKGKTLLFGSGDCQNEEEQQMKLKYEEWLVQFDQWITTQIHNLEAQIGKYRKTKKALNAKLRVVSLSDSTSLLIQLY